MAKFQFLTPEWVAAAHEVRDQFEGEVPPPAHSVRMNQVITDVPFGDGVINAYVDSSEGSLELELGELDEPDAVVTTDYETAKAMIVEQDPAAAMQAFLEGRVKVQGDMMKLMAMQAVPPNEASAELAAELQAITE